MEGASVVTQGQHGEQADDDRAANGAEGAEIADPLAQRETTHVQREQKRDDEQRGDAGEGVTVGQLLDRWSRYIDGYADTGKNHRGEIHHVRKPVTPAGQEAVLFAETALGPEIDASFTGPLLG